MEVTYKNNSQNNSSTRTNNDISFGVFINNNAYGYINNFTENVINIENQRADLTNDNNHPNIVSIDEGSDTTMNQ